MTDSPAQSLDQLGIRPDLRERAKMLWLITALGGIWGWVIVNFIWKVEGQEEDPWFQFQLKQSLFVGIIGVVGWVLCGIGVLVHFAFGVLGFLAINKDQDFVAPLIGEKARGDAPQIGTSDAGAGSGGGVAQGPVASGPVASGSPPASAQPQPQQPQAQPQQAQPQPPQKSAEPELDPIDGITLQHWAWGQAQIAQGHPLATVIEYLQVDEPRWSAAVDEWNARMLRDPGDTIAEAYRKYGGDPEALRREIEPQPAAPQPPPAQAQPPQQPQPPQAQPPQQAQPQQPQAQPPQQAQPQPPEGPEPCPFERWVEIKVALEISNEKGWDVDQLLGNFQMDRSVWDQADNWWIRAWAVRSQDPRHQQRHEQLRAHYEAHYRGA